MTSEKNFQSTKNILKKNIKNFTIESFRGGFGNNCQQIALGIIHSQKTNSNFYITGHKRINDFKIVNNPFSHLLRKKKHLSRFYYFDPTSEDKRIDYPLNAGFKYDTYQEINNVFKNTIYQNINFKDLINIPDDQLVIHIRSGDIFTFDKTNYLQNPIVYYLDLIKKFNKTIIVTDSANNSSDKFTENPVIKSLKKLDNVEIQSNGFVKDFNTLLSAPNLASSGVGTFVIAAALMSHRLKNFYCSDLYFRHHLNPGMLKNIPVTTYTFKNYKKIGSIWRNSSDDVQSMISKKVSISKVNQTIFS